jgi:hypothetical protein
MNSTESTDRRQSSRAERVEALARYADALRRRDPKSAWQIRAGLRAVGLAIDLEEAVAANPEREGGR